jgi:hypothetical protein
MPQPRGRRVSTHHFVDANDARNVVAHCSRTSILNFANQALVWWFSKKQNMVELSTFGSEFVALHVATEQLKVSRHKF